MTTDVQAAYNPVKKKICLIIHALSPGGMERVMSQLAVYFSRKDTIEIHLILYGIRRDVFYPLPSSVIIHRPEFTFKNDHRTWNTFRTLLFLRKTVKEINPNSILSFGEIWNNLVLLALYKLKIPVYISDRSTPGKNLGTLHNRLKKWLYPTATGLIAQTDKAKKVAESNHHIPNIRVIGNPIRDVMPNCSEIKENIVLIVGRIIRTKHLDELIRLFVRLNIPEWKLVIVGGDAQGQNLMNELDNLIRKLDVKERVELTGTQADVDSYYQKSKIFAFTSSSEGFPNVVGEAMSAGLPVVSFDCVAGPSEMIEDGKSGFLVDVFDYETFSEKLKLLMEDSALRHRLGTEARKTIQRFSVESVGEQFLSFILNEGTEID